MNRLIMNLKNNIIRGLYFYEDFLTNLNLLHSIQLKNIQFPVCTFAFIVLVAFGFVLFK